MIEQAFIQAEGVLAQDPKKFEAALFVLRKKAANKAADVLKPITYSIILYYVYININII